MSEARKRSGRISGVTELLCEQTMQEANLTGAFLHTQNARKNGAQQQSKQHGFEQH